MRAFLCSIDSTGDLVVKYDYTAYGECTVKQNSEGLAEINPFRYKGYYYDTESQMYYCNSRYYVPEWCRWLTADSPSYLQNGWMQSQTTSAFIAFTGQNALKHSIGMLGVETLLRMTMPALVIGGVGGGLYGRFSDTNGNFIAF